MATSVEIPPAAVLINAQCLTNSSSGAVVRARARVNEPLDPKSRLVLVDAIRGLAIFGILWVNVFLRSDPLQLSVLSSDHDMLSWLVALTGTLKFRSMFAFLFGLGLAMQSGRAADDKKFVHTYMRRLGILVLFGVLHFAFLWPGDILVMYTLCGMLLVSFRKVAVKRLLIIGSIFLLMAMGQQIIGSHIFNPKVLKADLVAAYPIYQHGTFWQITERRVHDYLMFWTPALWMTFPCVFAMMVFGMAFAKQQYFRRVEFHLVLWRRLCWIGYLVGIPLNAYFATWSIASDRSPAFTITAKIAQALGAPILCMAYLATMVVLSQTKLGKQALKWLAPVGRMSISAYLGHSIVCSGLFYGYGLGWFGQVTKAQDVLLCCALFVAEILFANAWFKFFKMGPIEWTWRWGTYGVRPAFLATGDVDVRRVTA
ncbi:MAG TPA: DUF418 domain-containing protein [Polyangiaceae bacterium]